MLVPTPAAGVRPSDLSIARAFATTLRNPLFVPYVVAQFLFWMALRVVLAPMAKFIEVRTGAAETQQGMVLAVCLLVAAICLPFMVPLAKRFGKKRILSAAMVYFGVMMVPLMFVGRLPLPLSALGQAVLLMALAGPAVATLFSLPNAMVADIVDHDERQTGQRREAIYYGAQGLIVAGGFHLGIAVATLECAHFGETAARQGGFVACALTAMFLAWLAAVVLRKYRGN